MSTTSVQEKQLVEEFGTSSAQHRATTFLLWLMYHSDTGDHVIKVYNGGEYQAQLRYSKVGNKIIFNQDEDNIALSMILADAFSGVEIIMVVFSSYRYLDDLKTCQGWLINQNGVIPRSSQQMSHNDAVMTPGYSPVDALHYDM